jgi:hypothetical protein
MRKLRVGYLAIAAVVSANSAEATYIIKLKNGNEYVTNRYWQEGAQIFFDAEGGVFGIDKVFVNKIEKTDQVIRLATANREDPAPSSPKETAKEAPNAEDLSSETPKKTREPNDPVVADLNQLIAKSKELDGMLTSEIRELLGQITAFRNKLIKDRKLFIEYPQELNDISNLSNTVEAALRSRTP